MPGATGFRTRWGQIERVATAPQRAGAERRAWKTVRDKDLTLNHVYFGTLCPSRESGLKTRLIIRIDGWSPNLLTVTGCFGGNVSRRISSGAKRTSTPKSAPAESDRDGGEGDFNGAESQTRSAAPRGAGGDRD